MKKYIYLVCCVFFFVEAFSQTNKELEFNVVKPKVGVSVKPNYKFLFQNISHPIQISINDSINNYVIRLAGGTVNETDSGTFLIPEVGKEVILNIYVLKEGSEKLIRSKKYPVLPEPQAYLRNKPTDNFLLEIMLVSGKLTGVTTYRGEKIVLKVKSFTVVYRSKDTGFKSVKVVGNNIPIPNREEISELSNGALIYFRDIMVELIPGYEAVIKPYRITMEAIDGSDATKFRTGN